MVKCWDLEANKVIRHYHGHLSGVYALAVHPLLDVLVTAGRDASARVWDMRTKAQVHVLAGHTGTVGALRCQAADPQVITGSMDSTVRLWDLAAGKTSVTLTHHKKSVRALDVHPTEYSFVSASAGGNGIKKWKCPEGTFVCNFPGQNAIVNTMSVNAEGVLFSGGAYSRAHAARDAALTRTHTAGDNGSIAFWDYGTGTPFQTLEDIPQPGSLEAEAGVFCSTFDQTGTRLITGCADKTIKVRLPALADRAPLTGGPADLLRAVIARWCGLYGLGRLLYSSAMVAVDSATRVRKVNIDACVLASRRGRAEKDASTPGRPSQRKVRVRHLAQEAEGNRPAPSLPSTNPGPRATHPSLCSASAPVRSL
jgi:hypothetical protein